MTHAQRADRPVSIDEAFHAVFDMMPPGWRFKGLYMATKVAYKRKPGNWYAQASGPDPYRPGTGFGATGEGGPGVTGAAIALRDLAHQLEEINLDFHDANA